MNKLLKSSTIIISYLALQTSAWALNTTYRLEIVETPEEFKNSFPIGINNQGDVASALPISGNRFDFPIDETLLDFNDVDTPEKFINDLVRSGQFGDTGFVTSLVAVYWESIRRGRYNATSLSMVMAYLNQNISDGQHQQIASIRSAFSDDTLLEELAIFDRENPETDEYTYFHPEHVHSINNLSWLAGETGSPLTKTEIDGETWLMPEFLNRGFVKYSNQAITLESRYDNKDALGGFSYATDISDSGYVVGYASVDGSPALDSLTDSCKAQDDTVPEEVCIWKALGNNKNGQIGAFKTRAYMWKVNGNGDVTARRELGIAINDPELAESNSYMSRAFGVNDAGIAVGESHVIDINERVRQQAVIFFEDNVYPLTNPQEYVSSRSIAINNNGIVIGILADRAGLTGVTKSFYYDIDSSGVNVELIDDFFSSANTKAKAINEQNLIVGETEASELASGSKPKHGFIFDLDAEQMYDLNNLLSCETDFTITDAVDINDDGTILARASYTQSRRNLMGEVVTNSTSGGDAIEQVEYTVRLIPDSTLGDSCDAPDNEVKIKRKGASFSYAWLCLFFITFLFKKRNIKSKTI